MATRKGVAGPRAVADVKPESAIVEAALKLAARDGWHDLTLSAIAREAGVPLSALYRMFRSKAAILAAYARRIDLAVIDQPSEPGEMPRDRLFDVVMLRFEAMAPHKEALRIIAYDLRRDPVAVLELLPAINRSLTWLMESAEISSDGIAGAVRLRVLGLLLARTFGVWVDEDNADLTRTMADLDRRLRSVERWLIPGGSRALPRAEETAAPSVGHG